MIDIRQIIINEREIKDDSPKKVWEYYTYSKEEYFERRNSEKF
jgi:hypothetical protein